MNKYKAITQAEENYAAFNEDYVHGVSEPHWKYKFGQEFVVEADSQEEAQRKADTLMDVFLDGCDPAYYVEYVIGVKFLEEDTEAYNLLECEYTCTCGRKGRRGGH
jgi:hypothetical protein